MCWVASLLSFIKGIVVVVFIKDFLWIFLCIHTCTWFCSQFVCRNIPQNSILSNFLLPRLRKKHTHMFCCCDDFWASVYQSGRCSKILNGKMTLEEHEISVRLFEHYSSTSWMMVQWAKITKIMATSAIVSKTNKRARCDNKRTVIRRNIACI